jgi:small subunit ribosomal protein S4e
MVSIAGSKKLKRQMAPLFWGISRKNKRFVVTVKPGTHSKDHSIPTAVFLRDVLKIVSTLREAKSSIYAGKVAVDGIKRKSLHHSIGLMDVVELENVSDIYRLVPMDGQILKPLKINESEKTKKLSKVISKTSIKGNKTQIGFHDGRSMISDIDVKVGDSCLLEIPKQKILEVIKMEKGCQVMIILGVNAGQIATIKKIEEGTFNLPRRALLSIGEKVIEISTEIIMAVGKDKPIIQVR